MRFRTEEGRRLDHHRGQCHVTLITLEGIGRRGAMVVQIVIMGMTMMMRQFDSETVCHDAGQRRENKEHRQQNQNQWLCVPSCCNVWHYTMAG